MNPTLKNVLAGLAGLVVGSIVNMAFVLVGPLLIPMPEGVDITSQEGLKASMSLMQPKNFLFPFLGHALGTLAGAYVTAKIAANRQLMLALIIGAFFLLGGISNVFTLGGPAWFNIVDIALAYLPMAYLGWKLAGGQRG